MSFGRDLKDFASSFMASYKMFSDEKHKDVYDDYLRAQAAAAGGASEGDAAFDRDFSGSSGGSGSSGSSGSSGKPSGNSKSQPIPTAQQQKLAHEYTQYLVNKGYAPEAAAGIVANAWHESAGFQPTIVGDGGDSIGLFQFNKRGELPGFQKWAAANKRDQADPYAQIDFVDHRMRTSGMFDQINKIGDVRGATKFFSDKYERPSKPMMDSRFGLADQVWGIYSKTASGGSGKPPAATADGAVPADPAGKPQPFGAPLPKGAGEAEVPQTLGAVDTGEDEGEWKPMQFAAAGGTVERIGNAPGESDPWTDAFNAQQAQIARLHAMNNARTQFDSAMRIQGAQQQGMAAMMRSPGTGGMTTMIDGQPSASGRTQGYFDARAMREWAKQYPQYAGDGSPRSFGRDYAAEAYKDAMARAQQRAVTPTTQAPSTGAATNMNGSDWRSWTGGPGTKNEGQVQQFADGGVVEFPLRAPYDPYQMPDDEYYDPNDPRLRDDYAEIGAVEVPPVERASIQRNVRVPPQEGPSPESERYPLTDPGRGQARGRPALYDPNNEGPNPAGPMMGEPDDAPAVGAADIVGENPGRGTAKGRPLPPAEKATPEVATKRAAPSRTARSAPAPEDGAVDAAPTLVSKAEIEANKMTPDEIAQLQGAREQARRIQKNAGADPDAAFAPVDGEGRSQVKFAGQVQPRDGASGGNLSTALGSGLKFIASAFGLDGAVGGGDGQGAQRFASGEGALSPQEYRALVKTVNPDGSLPPHQANERLIEAVYEHGEATGAGGEAARMLGGVMQAQRIQVMNAGGLAERYLKAGDVEKAIQTLKTGYDAIPDGNTVEIHRDERDGQFHYVQMDGSNKVIADGVITPEALQQQIQLAKSGRAYDQAVIRSAGASARPPGGGPEGGGGTQVAGDGAVDTSTAPRVQTASAGGESRPRSFEDVEPMPQPNGETLRTLTPAGRKAYMQRFKEGVLGPWLERKKDWTREQAEIGREERLDKRLSASEDRQTRQFQQQEAMRARSEEQRGKRDAAMQAERLRREEQMNKDRIAAEERAGDRNAMRPIPLPNDKSQLDELLTGAGDAVKTGLTQRLQVKDPAAADAEIAKWYDGVAMRNLRDAVVTAHRYAKVPLDSAADFVIKATQPGDTGMPKYNAEPIQNAPNDPAGGQLYRVTLGTGEAIILPKSAVQQLDMIRGSISRKLIDQGNAQSDQNRVMADEAAALDPIRRKRIERAGKLDAGPAIGVGGGY